MALELAAVAEAAPVRGHLSDLILGVQQLNTTNLSKRHAICAAIGALTIAVAVPHLAVAQGPGATGNKEIPHTADGKPDFNGTWTWPFPLQGDDRGASFSTSFDMKYFSPLKKDGEPFFKPPVGDPYLDEPRAFCMPSGFPSGMLAGYPMQMFQTAGYLVIVNEFQRMTRIIPLDGRPHREALEPSYYGDPVGHWEDDTLVIETTNFTRWMLDEYYYRDKNQYRMHSDAMRSIERIRYKSPTMLYYQITIDDPKIFSAPWSQEFQIVARPEWDATGLFEYVCDNLICPGGNCDADRE